MWYDELQVGQASLARLVGVQEVPDPETDDDARAGATTGSSSTTCASATAPDATCCTASTSTSRPASGSRSSGRPARASRRSAGSWRASTRRAPARSRWAAPRSRACRAETVRTQVALVNQEHHVFVGTLRDNLLLAKPDADDDELARRARVRRRDCPGSRRCPHGLDTEVGAGGHAPRPGPVAAGRARAADPRRPAHARARRGDLAARPARRAAPRALAQRRARGPHRHRDRAPAAHGVRRRPHRRRRRTAGSPSSAATTSSSPPTAPTPRSGAPGATPTDRVQAVTLLPMRVASVTPTTQPLPRRLPRSGRDAAGSFAVGGARRWSCTAYLAVRRRGRRSRHADLPGRS